MGNHSLQKRQENVMAHLHQCPGYILLGNTNNGSTFIKTITSRGASYQKTLYYVVEEVSPRQVPDQKNLYYVVEEASPEQFS